MTLGAALEGLGRHAAKVLAGGVFMGLLAPPFAALLRPLLVPAMVVILAVAMVRLDWRAIVGQGRRVGLIGLAAARVRRYRAGPGASLSYSESKPAISAGVA